MDFGNLGNLGSLLANAKNIQKQVEEMKSAIEKLTATGSSGGGLVKVTINGSFAMTDIHIDPICIDPRHPIMLQDLIKAAHFNAFEKLQEQIKSQYGSSLSQFQSLLG